MASEVAVDSLTRKTSIIISRNATMVSSLSPDDRLFDERYEKSESFDLGHVKERSLFIVSVGDGSVNPGFVDDNPDKNISSDCGLPQKNEFFDGHPNFNGKSDNFSVMAIAPFDEPVNDWHFNTNRAKSSERKLKNISNEQHDKEKS